ncbi:hypothetical protein WHJ47_14390, partial [Staphylococcus aureus]|uniref:hypothetical protein n=1 Tax=Staphylococcus aureus TaxID=1280 RepID=UPI0039BE27D7
MESVATKIHYECGAVVLESRFKKIGYAQFGEAWNKMESDTIRNTAFQFAAMGRAVGLPLRLETL